MAHLLIIGGSDAGISAALRAREVNPTWEVTIVLADRFPNYSICGLPFWLGGEIDDWRDLAHRKAEDIEARGIDLLLGHTARAIDPTDKTVTVMDEAGRSMHIPYDSLVIGTGAVPASPPIDGMPTLPEPPVSRPASGARSASAGRWRRTCRISTPPVTAGRLRAWPSPSGC